jgi:hypothetical protein
MDIIGVYIGVYIGVIPTTATPTGITITITTTITAACIITIIAIGETYRVVAVSRRIALWLAWRGHFPLELAPQLVKFGIGERARLGDIIVARLGLWRGPRSQVRQASSNAWLAVNVPPVQATTPDSLMIQRY